MQTPKYLLFHCFCEDFVADIFQIVLELTSKLSPHAVDALLKMILLQIKLEWVSIRREVACIEKG